MTTAFATVVPVTSQPTTSTSSAASAASARDARSEVRSIDGIEDSKSYNTTGAPVSDEEIREYIKRGNLQNMNTTVDGLKLMVDGDDVEITYSLAPVPFDRIRRITGYLVGSMDRWNDAKTAEEHDRVKHAVPAMRVAKDNPAA